MIANQQILEQLNIPPAPRRKAILSEVADTIVQYIVAGTPLNVLFVCTHNSRRSQAAQLWLGTCLYLHNIENIEVYSAGAVATAFNYRMVDAARRMGFKVNLQRTDEEEKYRVDSPFHPVFSQTFFSKTIDDQSLPTENVLVLHTCTDAEASCPVIHGATHTYSLPFRDPSRFDGHPHQDKLYEATFRHIGSEMMFLSKEVADQLVARNAIENVIG